MLIQILKRTKVGGGGQGLEGDSEDRTREVAIWEGLRSASLALRMEEGAIH